MNSVHKVRLPEVVNDLRRRLDEWRKNRPKLGPIPAPLWEEAAVLARDHGIYPIAKALRLDYNSLKRRMGVVSRATGTMPVDHPAFVEVALVSSPPASVEYPVELERSDGARMKVGLSRQEDLIALADSFWRWCA